MSTHDDTGKAGDERFEREAARLLRQGAEELDAATLSRLNRARQQALAELDRGSRRPAWLGSGWQPALGAAAVAALAVALWIGRGTPPAPGAPDAAPDVAAVAPADAAADLEVMLADENLELIEDLEFYEWLESDPAVEETPGPGLSG